MTNTGHRTCAIPPGLLRSIADAPHDDTARLVAADWCGDQRGYGFGDALLALWESQLRVGPAPVGLVFFGDGNGYANGYGYGNGDGNGYANGYGYGNGDGYGYGDGDGYGDGNGYGYANGNGNGNGYGDGDGDGYGDGKITLWERVMPEVGANQLIVLPHGWVICGHVAEQIGPYLFRVERTSVICRTGGVPWDELADGKQRDSATYRTWGTVTIGPQFVMSRSWAGELPTATN